MGQGVAFVDGAYIDAADAKLSIFDLGFIAMTCGAIKEVRAEFS